MRTWHLHRNHSKIHSEYCLFPRLGSALFCISFVIHGDLNNTLLYIHSWFDSWVCLNGIQIMRNESKKCMYVGSAIWKRFNGFIPRSHIYMYNLRQVIRALGRCAHGTQFIVKCLLARWRGIYDPRYIVSPSAKGWSANNLFKADTITFVKIAPPPCVSHSQN